ncbi:CLUMA_CG017686, isoform A [Clunio marinus]|uniref:CLUMA_CG017686, isoform A n=1 Tax=Clunio marinus TaxID=568069 RepID=A0A1J1IY29_9DIPT|nr:CLUMA_CG017686, isoform A [Clunio marinus]
MRNWLHWLSAVKSEKFFEIHLETIIDICHSFEKKDLASRYECKNLCQRSWLDIENIKMNQNLIRANHMD